MVVDGDERNVALVAEVTQPLAHPRHRKAVAAVLDDFGFDQFAIERAILVATPDLQLVAGLLVDGDDAGAKARLHPEHAQQLVGAVRQGLDHPTTELVAAIL